MEKIAPRVWRVSKFHRAESNTRAEHESTSDTLRLSHLSRDIEQLPGARMNQTIVVVVGKALHHFRRSSPAHRKRARPEDRERKKFLIPEGDDEGESGGKGLLSSQASTWGGPPALSSERRESRFSGIRGDRESGHA